MKSSLPLTFALLASVGVAACSPMQPPIPTAAAPSGPAPPTDPQIAHIAYTADNIDIKAGRLALQKTRDPRIRAFANDMIRDHTKVNNSALALVKQLGVTPEDNDTSRALTQQADTEYTALSALRGAAFDAEYIKNELAYHQTVNAAVTKTLIPSAQNPQLKALLQSAVPIFQEHEQHAQMLVDSMAGPTVRSTRGTGVPGALDGSGSPGAARGSSRN